MRFKPIHHYPKATPIKTGASSDLNNITLPKLHSNITRILWKGAAVHDLSQGLAYMLAERSPLGLMLFQDVLKKYHIKYTIDTVGDPSEHLRKIDRCYTDQVKQEAISPLYTMAFHFSTQNRSNIDPRTNVEYLREAADLVDDDLISRAVEDQPSLELLCVGVLADLWVKILTKNSFSEEFTSNIQYLYELIPALEAEHSKI